MKDAHRFVTCACGARVVNGEELSRATDDTVELVCSCGRRLEVGTGARGLMLLGELVPEGSVPVTGFSRELRRAPDVERYWFEARDASNRRTPVHIVFSPSAGIAEVKHSSAKPLRLTGITRPTEARRAWTAAAARPRKRSSSARVFEELGVTP